MPVPTPILELVSVHVPKCGGSSLGVALGRVYGKSLLHDTGDRPGDPASPMNANPEDFFQQAQVVLPALLAGKRAVHGHFHPRKYRSVQCSFRTAVIREPVARLISHYFYWQTMPPEPHSLHQDFLRQRPSLEEFAQVPFLRHFYTHVFFGGMKLADFDYIGTLENMPAAVAAIGRGIGHPLELVKENQGANPEYQGGLARIRGDAALWNKLAALLEDDVRFYEDARNRWS